MYAMIQVAGFQFRAEEGATLRVPQQKAEVGDKLHLEQVMLVKKSDESLIGTPYVDGAKVEAEVLAHTKGEKIRIYKYKRRTKYRRRQGHRQDYTDIKINKIVTP
jgi:large subunit ribosomal protein L21